MTKEQLKYLVKARITGQGMQIDAGSTLPIILNEMIDKAYAEQSFLSLERVAKYLYQVSFDTLPEWNGESAPILGGCSAYVQDGKLYRTFDFKYDNTAEFIVKTPHFEGMAFLHGLNDGELTEEQINQLPYRMVDGQNENGIKISTHILYNDWEWKGVGSKNIPLTMLPFIVLSKVKSMATIATDLNGVLDNLSLPTEMGEYLIQVLVTDGTTTYAILPPTSADSAYVLQDISAYPKMTNFRWYSADNVARIDESMQTRPTGIERYNLMPCPLADLAFTLAYESSARLSEFIGINETTKASTDEELTAIYNLAHTEYTNRKRDGKTWQTLHAVVYGNGMEQLYIQEDFSKAIIADMGEYAKSDSIGNLTDLKTDHKSNLVSAINELADITETAELVVSTTKSSAELKAIYDLVVAHPQLAKNIVVVGADGLNYPVNGYGIVEDLLHLHTIFNGESGLQDSLIKISANGSIIV